MTGLMQFLYDSADELIGFTYDGKTYFYVKNVQGDVTAVLDSSGTEVASYDYTAYGQPTDYVTGFAAVNPMRYRGYYYDDDFGAYYLQSRYYSPEFGRFLNSDLSEYAQLQKDDHYGINLFAYCCNDPINNVDYKGHKKVSKKDREKKIKIYKAAMKGKIKKYSLNAAASTNYDVSKDKYGLYTISCEYRMNKNSKGETVYYNAIYLYGNTSAWQKNYNELAKAADISGAFLEGFMDVPESFFMLIFIVELIIVFAGAVITTGNEAEFYKQCLDKCKKNGGKYGILQTFSKTTYKGSKSPKVEYIVSH